MYKKITIYFTLTLVGITGTFLSYRFMHSQPAASLVATGKAYQITVQPGAPIFGTLSGEKGLVAQNNEVFFEAFNFPSKSVAANVLENRTRAYTSAKSALADPKSGFETVLAELEGKPTSGGKLLKQVNSIFEEQKIELKREPLSAAAYLRNYLLLAAGRGVTIDVGLPETIFHVGYKPPKKNASRKALINSHLSGRSFAVKDGIYFDATYSEYLRNLQKELEDAQLRPAFIHALVSASLRSDFSHAAKLPASSRAVLIDFIVVYLAEAHRHVMDIERSPRWHDMLFELTMVAPFVVASGSRWAKGKLSKAKLTDFIYFVKNDSGISGTNRDRKALQEKITGAVIKLQSSDLSASGFDPAKNEDFFEYLSILANQTSEAVTANQCDAIASVLISTFERSQDLKTLFP